MMKKGKKLIAKLLCIVLVLSLMAPLGACRRRARRGDGVIAELADSKSAKDATFKKGSDIALDFVPERISANGSNILYYQMSYDMSEFMNGGNTEEFIDGETEETSEAIAEGEGEETAGETTEETAEEGTEDADTEENDVEEPMDDMGGDEEGGENSTPRYVLNFAIGDLEGNVSKSGRYIAGKGSGNVVSAKIDSKSNIRLIETIYETEEECGTGCFLLTVSPEGKELNRVKLNGIESAGGDSCAIYSDGGCAICTDRTILLFDSEGKKTGGVEVPGNIYINSIICNDAGDTYVTQYGGNGLLAKKVDFITGQLVGEFQLTGYGDLFVGQGYDFFLKNNIGIYGYKFEAGEEKMIMNFLDSDMQGNQVSSVTGIDDKNFIFIANEGDGSEPVVCFYTKVNPEDVKEKKIIVLGGLYLGYSNVNAMVMKFNKSNDEYRIRTFDYSIYNTQDDNSLAEKQLRNDILTHCGPDIIICNDLADTNVYADKQVFADLYPLMEKNGINKDDILKNIREAGSKDGNLYMYIPKFTISCMITKQAYVKNGNNGLSFKELADLEKQNNCVGSGMPYATRSEVMNNVLKFNANEFYDIAQGTCHFDSKGFKEMLEWLKNYSDDTETAYQKFENMDENEMFAKNAIIAKNVYLSSFRSFNRMEKIEVKEPASLIGFPSMEGKSSGIVSPELSLAISNMSEYQDACFEFLKLFMSDEYQKGDMETNCYTYNFPSNVNAFNRLGELAMEDPFYFEDGKKVYFKETSWSPQGDTEIEPITQERLQYCKDFILSCNKLGNSNSSVVDLVKEESSAYFNNQKSLDDVAKVVQSRVEIYVRENQ